MARSQKIVPGGVGGSGEAAAKANTEARDARPKRFFIALTRLEMATV